MEEQLYKGIIKEAPFGYAYHRIITDERGEPVDYVFLDINDEFKKLTGLTESKIINKKVTRVLPGIREGNFDWVKVFGDIALNGGDQVFEQYSEPLNKYYQVKVYSPKKNHFVTIFRDITDEIQIAETAHQFLVSDEDDINYHQLAQNILDLSGAKYISFNLFDEYGGGFTTKAIAGLEKFTRRSTKILGFDIVGKHWQYDPRWENKFQDNLTTSFDNLAELASDFLPGPAIKTIEKVFDIGQIAVIKIVKQDLILGNFTIIMPPNKNLRNKKLIETYAQQIGLYIDKKKTEEKLRTSEHNFRAFFETIDDMIIISNQDGKIFHTNHAVEKKLGYESEELAGMHILDLHPDSQREKAEQIFEEMFQGKRKICPLPLEKKNGETIPVETRVWFGKWNGKDAIFGISKDLAKEQEALQKFNRLFERNPDLMAVSNLPERQFTDVNQAFLNKLGYTREEIIGKTTSELDLFPEPEKQRQASRELKETGHISNLELKVKTKSGELLTGLFAGEIIKSQGEKYFLTVMTDITRQKEAEEELRKLSQAVQQSPTSVAITDEDGKIEWVNPKFEEITGYESQEVIGQDIHNLLTTNRQSEQDYQDLLDTIKSGEIWQGEFYNKRKDGSKYWESVNTSSIKNEQGETTNYLHVGKDITDQKKAEIKLQETNQALQKANQKSRKMAAKADAANKAKSEFLANMSHEIRTPLNSIIGFTELLLGTDLDQTQDKYLNNVLFSSRTLLDLINDILDFSKIEAGRLDLDYTQTDLIELLETSADIIKIRAHEKDLELLVNIDPDIPPVVSIDPVRLRQVLANLLSNAVKFTKQGEIEIRASLMKQHNNSAQIKFMVSDTGIGIQQDKLDKIFKSFTQADGSTTRRYGGTGLGLTISYQLVQKMGGELKVESILHEGSRFYFTLDLKVIKDKIPVQKPVEINNTLIIDDNSHNCTIIKKILAKWDIQSITACTANQGLEKYRKHQAQIDLVILDYQMPEMNGLELAQKIFSSSPKKPSILLYSSTARDINSVILKKYGIDKKLEKPIKQKELYETLRFFTGSEEPGQHSTKENKEENIFSKPLNLLIAEDNAMNMMLATNVLENLLPAITIIKASNGQEALEKYNQKPLDVILMDIQMPVMSGLEATRKIREKNQDIPIIALTAGVMKEEREESIEAGVDSFIGKPLNRQDLKEVLKEHLDFKELEDENIKKDASKEKNLLEFKKLSNKYDYKLVNKLLLTAYDSLPEHYKKIHNALDHKDISTLQRTAHTIKGMAMNLHTPALKDSADNLEKLAAKNNFENIKLEISEFNTIYRQTIQAIKEEIQ
ncbi:MAG TPA: PAS domain S-box protein [bacterium]|nr:PAS domain S-box protein [bacterium]